MPLVTSDSRKWEYAVVGFILVIASYLLFIPPIVGVADGGDYVRIAAHVGLEAPPGLSTSGGYNDRYGCWVVTRWNVVPPVDFPYFMVGEFPAWIAVHLSRGASMDIRWISGVHLAFLLGIILAIGRGARKLPAAAYAVVGVGLVLVCTDSEYIAHFNSLFGESEAFLGVLALVAAGLVAATADEVSWRHLFGIALAAAFFTGSKAQNAVLGLVAAGWLILLFKNKPAHRYVSAAVGVALACFVAFMVNTDTQPQFLFHAIYARLLPRSADPQATLTELGLKPETAAWKGKLYWDVNIQSPEIYPGKATNLKLLAYYLRHPMVDIRIARDSLSLNNDVPYLGNYPQESGAPCAQRTRGLTAYDRLRSHLASIWFVFPLLAGNIAATFIWRSRMGGLFSMLGIMALLAFPIGGSFYDTEPRKHLFTFNLLFDVLLFADLSAGAAYLAKLGVFANWGGVLGKRLRLAIAVSLVPVLGIAAWRDVVSKLSTGASVSNLAMHKPVRQSSTLPGYSISEAGSAVDGNIDGNFFHGSVASTNRETNPWWQVDLGSSQAIGSIAIWNRTDCCSSRLRDYWVFASDTPFGPGDTPATLQMRPGTWKSHQTATPDPSATFATAGARGRYVRVQLEGTDYLSLAEVQVSPFGPNLAMNKPATQSSALTGYSISEAGSAVDGNTDGNYFHGFVASTNRDTNAWWQVDLGSSQAIGAIVIWNRTDCCSSRLRDYWIFVSDTPFNPSDTPATLQIRPGTWKSHQTATPDLSTTLATAGARGRYVRVQLGGTDYLSLAEVQVFANDK